MRRASVAGATGAVGATDAVGVGRRAVAASATCHLIGRRSLEPFGCSVPYLAVGAFPPPPDGCGGGGRTRVDQSLLQFGELLTFDVLAERPELFYTHLYKVRPPNTRTGRDITLGRADQTLRFVIHRTDAHRIVDHSGPG